MLNTRTCSILVVEGNTYVSRKPKLTILNTLLFNIIPINTTSLIHLTSETN